MATDTLCLKEEDIIRLVEVYLDQRGLHMTLDALERETGVIRFKYSEEVVTLRQCIVDGRWREAVSYLRSLRLREEDLKFIIFEIMKQKYVELICVYEELGNELYDDLGNAIAICFSELSAYCSCPVEYENLRKLASLTKLSQDPKFEDWNPFASRRKCFNTIYSVLASEDNLYQLENNSEENRLLDLLVKGILYESCEEYCQLKASTKSESAAAFQFGSLVQPTQSVGSNLSLYSWLQSVPWITMTHNFVHRFLRVEVDKIERPEMRECWTGKILQSAKEFSPSLQNELQRPESSSENLKSRFWNKRIKDSMIVDASDILKRAEEVVNRWKTRQTQHLEVGKRIGHDTKVLNLREGKIDVHDQYPPQQTSASAKSSDLIPVMESLNECTSTITEIAHNHRISQQTFPTDKSSDVPYFDEENINEYISFAPDSHPPSEKSSIPQMLSELPPILEENLNESTPIIDEFRILQPSVDTEISSLDTNSAESQFLTDRFGCPVCSVAENDTFDLENDFKQQDTQNQPDRGDVSDRKQSIRDLIHAKLKLRGNLLKILKGEFPAKVERKSTSEHFAEVKQQNQVDSATAAAEIPRMNCFSKVTYIPPFYMQPYLLIKDSGALKKLFSTANESDTYRRSTTISSERKMKETSSRNLISATDKKSDISDKVPYKVKNFVSNRRLSSTTKTPGSSDSSEPKTNFVAVTQLEEEQAIRAVEFHPSGKFYAVGSNTKTLRICAYPNCADIRTDHEPREPTVLYKRQKHHKGSIYCMAWNATGDLLATGSNDKTVKLMKFSPATCQLEDIAHPLTMHGGTVRDMCFMEDISNRSNILISGGSGDNKIYITDCETAMPFQSLTGHTGQILSLYTWGGVMFVSSSQDKTIRFWDMRSRGCVNLIPARPSGGTGPGSAAAAVSVDPSGRLLVSGHEDASCMLYDMKGSRILQTFKPHTADVRTARLSPKAFYLLTGSYDCKLMLTDLQGDLTQTLATVCVAEHSDKVIQGRWHPHEFTFLSTSADKMATLWALPAT